MCPILYVKVGKVDGVILFLRETSQTCAHKNSLDGAFSSKVVIFAVTSLNMWRYMKLT